MTAKLIASLDLLSGGRVILGIGAGWLHEETRDSLPVGSTGRNRSWKRRTLRNSATFSDIHVNPDHRGKGIPSRLLETAEAYFAASGIGRLRLSVLAAHTAARAAYRKYGFQPYEIFARNAMRAPSVDSFMNCKVGAGRMYIHATKSCCASPSPRSGLGSSGTRSTHRA